MLDVRWMLSNIDLVKKSLTMRRHETFCVDKVSTLDERRRTIIQELEQLRANRNKNAKEIGALKKKGEDASELMANSKSENLRIGELDEQLRQVDEELTSSMLQIPNILDDSVPEGKGEEDNVEIEKWGTPNEFSFKVKDHHELGEHLGIIDFERSGKIAGARFSTLLGQGARLNRALIEFMLEMHTTKHDFTEILPPFLVNSASLTGTSQLPKFHEDLFKIDNWDLYLNPTSEVPVTNFYRDEILSEKQLPIKFTAYTPCFRSEAGSYGKDTRGLIRQHQFEKVELVVFSHPDKSEEMHEAIRTSAEAVLQALELPYRLVRICAGDIGFGGAKQYDLEVWLPSQGCYREISSCSNFLDYQARRASIRFRPNGGRKPSFVHTLNGSALAIGRTLLALMENHQQEDGTIKIPEALQKYTGFDRITPRN